jgi:hypothetical protein
MSKDFRERPVRRVNPSGAAVWVARVTGLDGRRFAYKREWNRGKGTFARRGDAQRAIDEYYEPRYRQAGNPETVGAYAAAWTKRYPRVASESRFGAISRLSTRLRGGARTLTSKRQRFGGLHTLASPGKQARARRRR